MANYTEDQRAAIMNLILRSKDAPIKGVQRFKDGGLPHYYLTDGFVVVDALSPLTPETERLPKSVARVSVRPPRETLVKFQNRVKEFYAAMRSPLPLPPPYKLKQMAERQEKTGKPVVIRFPDGHHINPYYLLSAVRICGKGCRAMTTENPLAPILVYSDDYDLSAYVFPVHPAVISPETKVLDWPSVNIA